MLWSILQWLRSRPARKTASGGSRPCGTARRSVPITDVKVFISWSGERAKLLANAMHGWLPEILQSAQPFFSDLDINPGSFSHEKLRQRFADADFCIVCVTPETVNQPWINYEAGAIAEKLGGRTTPWLFDMAPEHMKATPLSRLQARKADKSDTLSLIEEINRCSPKPVDEKVVAKTFARFWPDLADRLKAIPPTDAPPKKVTTDELLSELAFYVRDMDQRFERLESLIPIDVLMSKSPSTRAWREEYMRMLGQLALKRDFREILTRRDQPRRRSSRKSAEVAEPRRSIGQRKPKK
jgi:hypothetical protein